MGLEFGKEKFGLEIEFSKARSDKVIKELNKIPKNKEEKYNKWKYTTETFNEKKKDIIYGGEVQSPILTNNKKSLNNLKYVLNKLKKI